MPPSSSTTQIEAARISWLNGAEPDADGAYVLYWMQASQRSRHNPALEFAVQQANALNKPMLVAFGLMADYPRANARHYQFMLQGLLDVQQDLAERNIRMVVQHGHPADIALRLGRRAALIVCDCGYLSHQRAWRDRVADEATVRVVRVEGDAVVPVDEASDKQEYAARTLRPKIAKLHDQYLIALRTTPVDRSSMDLSVESLDLSDPRQVTTALRLDRSVPAVPLFKGGQTEAAVVLNGFIKNHLHHYSTSRNQPQTDAVSHMSKYLHFGQISPVALALQIRDAAGPLDDVADYLEELIVRRELAINYVHFNHHYASYTGLPRWAQLTLRQHRDDPREHIYTARQLEDAQTHDPYWNAAMREMRHTGYTHNYMRMYWGKKIIEWTKTPEYAHKVALHLNDKYFIDGRDPVSYANINWLFGLHDRPWAERPIFGTIRYMNANGLKRKADPDAYVQKVDAICRDLGV